MKLGGEIKTRRSSVRDEIQVREREAAFAPQHGKESKIPNESSLGI
jgi:hypothetical protein